MSSRQLKAEDVLMELEKTKGLERDYLKEVLASRQKAWRISFASLGLAALSLAAVVGLTPLKEPPEMYVVRVNDATGEVEHVSRLGDAQDEYSERTAKRNLNEYILNCEGYHWYTIQDQHDRCLLLSSPEVQRKYSLKYEGQNAIHETLGSEASIDVDVHSITLGMNKTAVVRFSTTQTDAYGRPSAPQQHKIATISYRYINAAVSEKVARVNDLGFQVTSYQVDADLSRQ